MEQEPDQPSAADWKVIKQNVLKKPPAKLKHKVDADLEGKVVYLGLDVDRDVIRPGVQFTLTHYWQVKKRVPGWKVFTHIDLPGKKGRKYFMNADHKPIGGRYPATLWKAGEIIRDVHQVTLRSNWDQPQAKVFVGLWKGQLRMKPRSGPKDAQNRVLAAVLKVDAKNARKPKLKRLLATRTATPVKIDGKLDDPVWAKTRSSGLFVNTMNGRRVPIRTEAKVAWDDKFLYVAFDNKDDNVWSELKERDQELWTQEVVEIFLDANADGKDYVELQVNPLGTIFDTYLARYRKRDDAWNSKMKAAVHVDGTVNKPDDKDKGWTVEVAIPWADTKGKGSYALQLPPKPGDVWRFNMFRIDKPAKDKKRQLMAGWSPPLVGDFHKLDRFGELVFADEQGKAPAPAKKAGVPASGTPKRATAAGPAKVMPRRSGARVVRMANPGGRGPRKIPLRRAKVLRPKSGPKQPAKKAKKESR